jgi:curved DNA-binding protein CbpA
MLDMKTLDFYEFLQISPHADADTVHRVYRFLAARFHPDNTETGDPEKFFLLKSVYDILSDPVRRAEYDVNRELHGAEKAPLSRSVDFMDDIQGEHNRRLAVLAVLYYRRRTNPYSPEVGLPELEKRMGFPRDYLDFTTWYLTKKGYITKADNSDFTLTAEGVDFVETQRTNIPVLNKMLTNGSRSHTASYVEEREVRVESAEPAAIQL